MAKAHRNQRPPCLQCRPSLALQIHNRNGEAPHSPLLKPQESLGSKTSFLWSALHGGGLRSHFKLPNLPKPQPENVCLKNDSRKDGRWRQLTGTTTLLSQSSGSTHPWLSMVVWGLANDMQPVGQSVVVGAGI